MKKILITGGAGFIGSNLIRYLIEQSEHQVLNVDKLSYAGNTESLQDLAGNERYAFIRADLVDAKAMRTAVCGYAPDLVMHLAAESHVDRSIDGPSSFVETNVTGTFNLLEAVLAYWQGLNGIRKEAFRFHHVSTDEVYGSLHEDEPAFEETTPYRPRSPYSASKAASDHLVRSWNATYGLPVVVSNCSNNYGPFQFPEKLVPVVILKCLREEPIPVYGKGENIRDWLYVGDHVEALYAVASRGRVGETYNIGGDNEWRNIDLVRMICGLMDDFRPRRDGTSYRELITFVADRPGHDLRYAINARKIRHELDWEPREDHESGFAKTVKWYLENHTWWERILNRKYNLERLGKRI